MCVCVCVGSMNGEIRIYDTRALEAPAETLRAPGPLAAVAVHPLHDLIAWSDPKHLAISPPPSFLAFSCIPLDPFCKKPDVLISFLMVLHSRAKLSGQYNKL